MVGGGNGCVKYDANVEVGGAAVDGLFDHYLGICYVKRTSKFTAQDEQNLCTISDQVNISLAHFHSSLNKK